jgi:hypothetical protein
MQLLPDRTGFPLLHLPDAGVQVALLPCTKAQLEQFLAEPHEPFGDPWYEEVLTVNPRTSWRCSPEQHPERLFLTGALPDEVLAFARWLGPDFDLPTAQQWQLVDRTLALGLLDVADLERGLANCCLAARTMLGHFRRLRQPRTWADLALLRGGLVEWVRHDKAFAGMGCPSPELWHNLYNPQRKEVVDIFPGRRLDFVGFRLLRCL